MRPRRRPPLAGSLLLAHPSLKDPNFQRTVVFMSAHDGEGAMGVVVNRPLARTLGQLAEGFAETPLAGVRVYRGGPVQADRLVLAAWRFNPNGDGFKLYFGLEPDKAIKLVQEDDPAVEVRAFAGYSGWSAGQLENELKHEAWVVSDVPGDLFQLPGRTELWREVLGRQGELWKLMAGEPEDPELN